jgi:NAD(P)H-dependent flavin oxidoreductase YrpB (nitropropane dioxygenase family)
VTIETPLCRHLGIRHPIFGLSHSVEVTIALARASGFAVYSAARDTPEQIVEHAAAIREGVGALPWGIDLLLPPNIGDETDRSTVLARLPAAHRDFVDGLRDKYKVPKATKPHFFASQVRSRAFFAAQIEAVLGAGATAFVTGTGLGGDAIQRAKRAGMTTFSLVGARKHAAAAIAAGIDILVAQGYDAGGHTGSIGTLSLVPQIVDAAGGRPVLAAGGIGDGRQIAAALAMGAEGAWLGTAWLFSREHALDRPLLDKLLAAGSEDTVISRAHSGKPCRVVRSAWTDEWDAPGAPKPLAMPYQQVLSGELLAAVEEHGIVPLRYEAAGQSVAWFREVRPVAEIVARLLAETEAALARLERVVRA